jgi:hypothetical protein
MLGVQPLYSWTLRFPFLITTCPSMNRLNQIEPATFSILSCRAFFVDSVLQYFRRRLYDGQFLKPFWTELSKCLSSVLLRRTLVALPSFKASSSLLMVIRLLNLFVNIYTITYVFYLFRLM